MDVNARDNNNATPLHGATSKKLSELLISKGSYINARDSMGRTPIRIAMMRVKKDVAELLRSQGAIID